MAIPVARVHLKMAHAALPALLPTPPIPAPCIAAILQAKPLAQPRPGPSRADADERWDARKTKPAARKNTTSPPPMPGRADTVERWDAHKKTAPAASPASSPPPSSSSGKWTSISRASSAERWDVHKKRCLPQTKLIGDGESSSTGSNDKDDTEEEEILWKPRALFAGPGFVVAAPQPRMIPMPAAFLVPVA